MTKSILAALALATATAPASVTLTFDLDMEGFVAQGDVTSAVWSAEHGGTMRMEDSGNMWGGNGAQLSLTSNPAMWAEVQLAVINGGTISYDFTVVDADQEYTAAPGWFETVIIGNSGAPGGWDQSIINSGITGADWPVNQTFNVSVPIQPTAGGAVDGADSEWFVDLTAGWANIHMGMNGENNGTPPSPSSISTTSRSTPFRNRPRSFSAAFPSAPFFAGGAPERRRRCDGLSLPDQP